MNNSSSTNNQSSSAAAHRQLITNQGQVLHTLASPKSETSLSSLNLMKMKHMHYMMDETSFDITGGG